MARPKKIVDVGVSAIVTNKGENCVELRLRPAFGMERVFALPPDLARTMANMVMCCAGFVEQTLELSHFLKGDVDGEQSHTIESEPYGDARRKERRNDDACREVQSTGDQDA